MTGYDIIGDVHGCATKLRALLGELGYRQDRSGTYRHPDRTAVFVGDLIDRGKDQLDVLQIVKAMVDDGNAHIVMGNHEFNAIAWATTHPDTGQPLRKHSDNNHRQHREFLHRLTPAQQKHFLTWFTTLPLWLDLGAIRVVHACWHRESIETIRAATGSDRLSTLEHLVEANRAGSKLYEAVEVLLKGPEINLPDHNMCAYWDHEAATPRPNARIRWWDHDATTLPALAELRGATLRNGDTYPHYQPRDVHDRYLSYIYTDRVPLFYGHYWREWKPVHRDEWTTYTACVDFSATRGGTLVAYRWNGEPEVYWENYSEHDPAVVASSSPDQTI